MSVPAYYIASAESGPYTMDQLKTIASQCAGPFKFFREDGTLAGTMYPSGESVTSPHREEGWGSGRRA